MTTINQERKTIAAVTCPTCGAALGRPCRMRGARPMTCTARREAWRAMRDAQAVDYVLTPHAEGPPGQRVQYVLVSPQSDRARDHLLLLATGHGWVWTVGSARVPHAAMPRLSRILAEAGWRTGETPA